MTETTRIHLIVSPCVADTTALTAWDTLRQEMGASEELERLERHLLWEFRIAKPREKALQFAEHLAGRTKLFVNPNKHRHRVVAAEESAPTVTEVEPEKYLARIWVTYREDTRGPIALETLRRLYKVGPELVDCVPGDLWVILLKAPTPAAAEQLLDRYLALESISQGFLVNPHSQTAVPA